jgi:hypothetical protein
MKILFLAYTSKKYEGHGMVIDRADLTRKMSCLETWVPRIEKKGHEVIFFDGSNETQYFDKENKILHLLADETYDHPWLRNTRPSFMIERLKEAIKWSLENVEFDYIFRTDDGSYINAYVLDDMINEIQENLPDVISNGYGGAGMLFSRHFCEKFVEECVDEHFIGIEDNVLMNFISNSKHGFKVRSSNLLHYQYMVGEKLFTIHYTNGKRQYFVDDIMSYYYTGNPIRRKVSVGLQLHEILPPEKTTLYTTSWNTGGGRTDLWYSFDKDDTNWEFYDAYPRTTYSPVTTPCVFGKKSVSELLLSNCVHNFSDNYEEKDFIEYVRALTTDGILYIHFSKDFFINENVTKHNQHLYASVEEYIKYLEKYMDVVCVTDDVTQTGIQSEFLQFATGTFIKLKNKEI